MAEIVGERRKCRTFPANAYMALPGAQVILIKDSLGVNDWIIVIWRDNNGEWQEWTGRVHTITAHVCWISYINPETGLHFGGDEELLLPFPNADVQYASVMRKAAAVELPVAPMMRGGKKVPARPPQNPQQLNPVGARPEPVVEQLVRELKIMNKKNKKNDSDSDSSSDNSSSDDNKPMDLISVKSWARELEGTHGLKFLDMFLRNELKISHNESSRAVTESLELVSSWAASLQNVQDWHVCEKTVAYGNHLLNQLRIAVAGRDGFNTTQLKRQFVAKVNKKDTLGVLISQQRLPDKRTDRRTTDRRRRDIKDVTCYNCGELGHYSNKCTKKNKDEKDLNQKGGEASPATVVAKRK